MLLGSASYNKLMVKQEEKKEKGWYTAFYRYAEFLRVLTEGAVNHKLLYALVGSQGRYVNHANSEVRRRSAGNLSKLLHSPRYAQDMRDCLAQNPNVFWDAAGTLSVQLMEETGYSAAQMSKVLIQRAWPELREGLLAEISDGRMEVNLRRLDSETDLMTSWVLKNCAGPDPLLCLETVLVNFFHIMAFAHVEEGFANQLVDGSPTNLLVSKEELTPQVSRACLLRAVADDPSAIENMWAIDNAGSFAIGRYMDCDAIETDGLVSRRHCRIVHDGDTWFLEDQGSTHGTLVRRDGQEAWNSQDDQGVQRFPLCFGDNIVLAGHIHYWFVSLQNSERFVVG